MSDDVSRDAKSTPGFSLARWPLAGFWFGNGVLLCIGCAGLLFKLVYAMIYGRMLSLGFSRYLLLSALITVVFAVGGVFSLRTAWQLWRRQKSGIYASLVLGLAMLFLVPFAMLINAPDDYVGPIVSGSIAILVVYLSIAGAM